MYIKDMAVGDKIEGFFLLQSALLKTTQAGKPYLSMVLSDRTGAVDAQFWDYSGPVNQSDTGAVVKIRGVVSEFRGMLQITVERLRPADANDRYSVGDLVPTAPIDVEEVWKKLLLTVDTIADEDYRAICREMLKRYGEKVKSLPAGKSVHHSFLNGLLMHTVNMLQTAEFLAGLYGEVIDRSLLIAGTLLHDFAKCEEFLTSPLGLVTDYSVKGQLLGHLVIGAQAVAEAAFSLRIPEEKSVLLQHLILSHHGEPEFGAAVRPMCAEGELLSIIDMIDSRMEIYRETLEGMPAGEFSNRIFALEKRIYRHQ
ncbi:MAG: HD domain-containing protein [Clostridiales bacterium]|jgi:3'-5' exoribonuclease|nr:HD domain-containing protein [Clostridiales bacterium]